MDSYQDYQKAQKDLQELKDFPYLDEYKEAEKEKLQSEINDFKEKLTNFE